MGCLYQPNCGGCCFRDKTQAEYQALKEQKVKAILSAGLKEQNYNWNKPVFLPDGTRRRAALAFMQTKGGLVLGFNENKSSQITDCKQCLMLTPKINAVLPSLRKFLAEFCAIKVTQKSKGKKLLTSSVNKGDVLILEADNGLDIVLEADCELALDYRMAIFDYVNAEPDIIRFSFRRKTEEQAEPVVEKLKPVIKIAGFDIYIAAGTFLQASKAGQDALTSLVLKYIGGIKGKIADLFCGIGTFSYPLAANKENKITAADSSEPLLQGFKTSLNAHILNNVEIVKRNLFKYPFTASELKGFNAVVFDPPRAGATAQAAELAKMEQKDKPAIVVAVSCNPHSFVNDANVLTAGGYELKEVTMVDQFVYSNHTELAALFTKK
jgi:23S rRNA (uracil1939-C5)-methyltransferase